MKEILIYGPIGQTVLAADILRQFHEAAGEDVTLRIHSEGGSVFHGLAILGAIRSHDAPVSAVIDGVAFSMAANIALEVRDRLTMHEDGWIMFHEVQWGGSGEASDLRAKAAQMEAMNADLVSRLAPALNMTEEATAQALKEEIWLNGAEAHEVGLVANMAKSQALAAYAAPGQWKNAPEQFLNKLDHPAQDSKDSRDETFRLAFFQGRR